MVVISDGLLGRSSHFLSPSPPLSIVTASAPGKVLIAGGYLVLERPNAGLIVSSSSRFHTSVSWCTALDREPSLAASAILRRNYAEVSLAEALCDASSGIQLPVVLLSPQFHSQQKCLLSVSPPHVLSVQ
jgi:hypothetical protein